MPLLFGQVLSDLLLNSYFSVKKGSVAVIYSKGKYISALNYFVFKVLYNFEKFLEHFFAHLLIYHHSVVAVF